MTLSRIFGRGQTFGPVRPINIRVDFLFRKVQPDAAVLAAVEGATGNRSMLVNAAAGIAGLKVYAISVTAVLDQVRFAQAPVDDPLADVLLRKGKWNPAAGPAAKMDPARAIDADVVAEGVLVVFGILEHGTHVLFLEILRQPLSNGVFALVEFLQRDNSFLAQQFNQGLNKSRRLKGLGGVGIQPTVGVKQALGHFLAQIMKNVPVIRSIIVLHESQFLSACKIPVI